MCDSGRLYNCALCHQQVIICSHCDRGNIYCADGCAQYARTHKQKAASKRYQSSPRGRQCHARRQRQYRQRQQGKVTHQGSSKLSAYDLLLCKPKVLSQAVKYPKQHKRPTVSCHFCGNYCHQGLCFVFLHQQTVRSDSFRL